MRNPEGVGFPIHVQAGYLGQHHPGIETLGVGRAGEHLNLVSQLDQSAAEVTDVNPLAAAVRFAAIRQQRNPHTHAHPGLAVPTLALIDKKAAEASGTTSGNSLDTCLDYSLAIYLMQRGHDACGAGL